MKLPSKALLEEFRKFYEATSKEEFIEYCTKHEITGEMAMEYLDAVYGEGYVKEILQ